MTLPQFASAVVGGDRRRRPRRRGHRVTAAAVAVALDRQTGGMTDELRAAERRLQAAQLASDVDALDALIDERLVFTGPDGLLYGKQDDLRVHRSGEQRMTRVDEEDLRVLVVGSTGVTWFLGTLEGTTPDGPFTARVRYTRTWVHDGGAWRLVAAHVSAAA